MRSFCYFAWFQANANAGITKGSTAHGALTTIASTLDVQNYTVDFDIVLDNSELELSHVATADEASAGLGGIAAANLNAGDLVYGGVYNGAVKLKKATATTNLITTYTVSASWNSAPTDPAEIEYLDGKYFTATMSVGESNARFVGVATSSLTNSTTATIVFQIGYDDAADPGQEWSFTPGTASILGIHVEPTNVNTTSLDEGTAGSVTVSAVSSLRTTAAE